MLSVPAAFEPELLNIEICATMPGSVHKNNLDSVVLKHHLRISAAFAALLVMLYACGGGGSGDGGNSSTASLPAVEQFGDVTAASGINYVNGYVVLPPADSEYDRVAPAGAAAGDYDGDGDVDLFVVRGDVGPNLLYRNTGNLVFEDVAAQAGIAFTKSATENYRHAGPMFADMDGDGDLDLFLGGVEGDPSIIFSNNGDGTFTDVSAGSGIDTMGAQYTISAAFGDYDLDGDLDLFLAHWGTPRDFISPGDTENLWRNDSDASGIKFTSVSVSAGISPTIINLPDPLTVRDTADWSFAPAFARINDDLYPDILSVADFNHSAIFINNQDGTFTNATDVAVIIDSNGMGSAVGDYDNDGDLDWFVSSIKDTREIRRIGNRLYRNNNGVFEDATLEAGVASGSWGWGSCFIDFENDADLDIYHTNGWPFADWRADLSRAFLSNGAGQFEEKAAELGLDDTQEGRGIVCADFDNDGDIDIFQQHRDTELSATLWRNGTSGNNYLKVKLNGLPPNTEASGARIYITAGGTTQMREISIASNFVSQNPTVQTIGLGSAAQADELRIQWPDGLETLLPNVQAGQTIEIDHPSL
jgi:hypothetical protein